MQPAVLKHAGGHCAVCASTSLRGVSMTCAERLHNRDHKLCGCVTVFSHYYGPLVRTHQPIECSVCFALHFHNWVSPFETNDGQNHMFLVGKPDQHISHQTSLGNHAFSLDLLRCFECKLATANMTAHAFVRSYVSFGVSRAPALIGSADHSSGLTFCMPF